MYSIEKKRINGISDCELERKRDSAGDFIIDSVDEHIKDRKEKEKHARPRI